MSESKEKIRLLKCDLELVEESVESLKNDNYSLTYQLILERKKTKMLEESVRFETDERISQERKSGAVLYIGIVSMVIYFVIIGFYVFVS